MKYIIAVVIFALLLCSCGDKVEIVDDKLMVVWEDGSTTPIISIARDYATRNTAKTVIENFQGGSRHKVISMYFDDNQTTLDSNNYIRLMGLLEFEPIQGDSITLAYMDGVWSELGRSLK